MITEILIIIVFGSIRLIVAGLALILGSWTFPVEVANAWIYLFGLMGKWNQWFPVSDVFAIALLIIAIEYGNVLWGFIKWIFSAIRGTNLYSSNSNE